MEAASEEAKTETYLAQILPDRVDALLEKRFKEQKIIEIETTELISEKAIKCLKIFGFFLGIPVALMISIISFVGVKTYRNIEDAAVRATALENALSGPETQLAEIKRRINQLESDLKSRITELAKDQETTQQTIDDVQSELSIQPAAIRGQVLPLRRKIRGLSDPQIFELARELGLVKRNERLARSQAESRIANELDLARENETDFGKFKAAVDKVTGK